MAGPEETDCITEALIREYLTKKGLSGTLDTFNSEKPAVGTQRINKRSQLVKLLGLEAAVGRQKSAANQQTAVATLDMLVEHTVQKLRLQASEPCTSSIAKASVSDCSVSSQNRSTKSDAYGLPQQQPAATGVLPVRPVVSSPCSIGADTSPAVPTKPHSAPAAGTSARRPGSASQEHSSAGQPAPRSRVRAAAPLEAPSMEQTARAAAARGPITQDDLHIEDVDDFDDDADVAGHVVAAPSTLRGSVGTSSSSGIGIHGRSPAQGQQLQPEHAKQLRQLLWGGQGGPPPCWQQGLFFSSAPGLSWGLVQLQGGPCGVLAAVQGFVLAALQVQGLLGHALQPNLQQRQEALADALSDILWQARPGGFGPACVVSAAAAGARQGLQSLSYDQLNRECVVRTASSRAELGAVIRAALPQLSEPRGWGIMLLLHSLLLTRGTDTTRQDTDEADSSLVGPHGYCTNELVNLVLTGQATSNVFDGQQSLGPESLLRGVSKRGKVGVLTLFEWYRYVEVGANLKSPLCPIWVVCSESHYSTLFVMPDDANSVSAWGQISHKLQPPLQLSYYDGLANQEGPIGLAVAPAPSGGWTTKLAGVAEERGVWQGRPIPPLELVIETKWPNVHVQWQGCEPLL